MCPNGGGSVGGGISACVCLLCFESARYSDEPSGQNARNAFWARGHFSARYVEAYKSSSPAAIYVLSGTMLDRRTHSWYR